MIVERYVAERVKPSVIGIADLGSSSIWLGVVANKLEHLLKPVPGIRWNVEPVLPAE